jgi:hypothetical protein
MELEIWTAAGRKSDSFKLDQHPVLNLFGWILLAFLGALTALAIPWFRKLAALQREVLT